ncbi:hypothetical protein [Sphingomicrobium sediminis]|uniref:Uncharacterized protein n=1 Tax=Sphingomicrobium sediminis TaxID=2950949 RepID=A0A9X2J1Y9_9SPHN|nr:hypothetical protein [Sphingomicrobium sediminis]MCM8557244.1 hypothetical protein [Sphingomicrobium sediminis]
MKSIALFPLVIAGMVGAAIAAPAPAKAQAGSDPIIEGLCNVDHFAVFKDSVRIKCGRQNNSGLYHGPYFVMTVSDWEHANLIAQVVTQTKNANNPKPVRLWYDKRGQLNPGNCNIENCRTLVAVAME